MVPLAVDDQNGTAHLADDRRERELFQPLPGLLGRRAPRQPLELGADGWVVVKKLHRREQRPEDHQPLDALLKGRRARGVISAEAPADEAQAVRVHFGPGGQEVQRRAHGDLVIGPADDLLEPEGLPLPRSVHDEEGEPPLDERFARQEVELLLQDVRPGHVDRPRRRIFPGRAIGGVEVSLEGRALIWDLDPLGGGVEMRAGLPEGVDAPPVRGEPPRVVRREEELRPAVIVARPQEVVPAGDRPAFGQGFLPQARHPVRQGLPLDVPAFRVAHPDPRRRPQAFLGLPPAVIGFGDRPQQMPGPVVVLGPEFEHDASRAQRLPAGFRSSITTR